MDRKRVLFVCVHNSARSQMAEAYLKELSGDVFEVESAGLEPGKLNMYVVAVMKEKGINISQKSTKSVFDLIKQGKQYQYVITVCSETEGERCPVFPGAVERLHWGFDDPSRFTGTYEEKLQESRIVRDAIKKKLEAWIQTVS